MILGGLRSVFLSGLAFCVVVTMTQAGPAYAETKATKKKLVYKSHTQVDLSGETVEGKVRAPEVFYIFQRKRSEAHHVVRAPANLDYHHDLAIDAVRRDLPK